MPDPVLTNGILIVFGLLGVAVLLFVVDWLRVDLVGILMMISLPLTGVLDNCKNKKRIIVVSNTP
jgi:hypothetical protein